MWGCSRWPDCNGAINIEPEAGATIDEEPKILRQTGTAGAYAQARMERERAQARLKRRATLPFVVGIAVIAMTIVFYGSQQFGFLAASLAVTVTGLLFSYLFLRLPFDAMFWTQGVEGERKTAAFVEPLLDAGYVVDGKRLARLISDRAAIFDDEDVQRIARLADRRLRLPYEWEAPPP